MKIVNEISPHWYPKAENSKKILEFFLWYSRLDFALKKVYGNRTNDRDNIKKLQTEMSKIQISSELNDIVTYFENKPVNNINRPYQRIFDTGWEMLIE